MTNVEFLHDPRSTCIDALRRIGRSLHREGRDITRILMLPVSVRRRSAEDGDDDMRLERTDNADDIAENYFLVPFLFRLVQRFRKSVIVSTCEKLMCSVESSRL